jgi:hypothetical protein
MSIRLTAAAVIAALTIVPLPAFAQRAASAPAPELALQLDFLDVDGLTVRDAAGHGHDARLERAVVVHERTRTAVKLGGRGEVTVIASAPALEVGQRVLTVGGRCKPAAADGVIVSMGDATDGFSLYLRGGVPHFAVRSNGVLHTAVASGPIELNAWSHVAGVIGPSGELTIVVNTMPDGTAPGATLSHTPAERLSIGADPGSPVGDYTGPMRFRGLLGDVRVYWGEVGRGRSAALLGDWADRPMCGMSR